MRNDLPSDSASNFSSRVRETLMTYLGKQGDPLDRGITLRDLIDSGFATWAGGKIGNGSIPLKPGQVITDSAAAPDLTPPPTPTNFIATAGITTFLAQHDTPTYTQGGGHLRTRLYGKIRSAGDPAPVFADATEIAQFTGAIYAHSTNPATTWHLWAKWETKAGVLSASPAGGTNGVVVTTGQDVSKLLDALTGKITAGQLYSDLGSRIDLIDGPSTLAGSVAARIASEASARTTAIDTAVGNLQDQIDAFVAASGGDVGALLAAINTEQGSRIQGDTALANQNTLLLAISGANTAAIGVESLTRASSDSALSQTVTTLVARTGTNTAAILNESEVRSQADAASAYQIAGLKTSVDESVAGLTVEREVRATSDSAISTQLTALSASVGDSRGAILAEQNVRAAADQVQVSATTGLSAIVAATSAALTTEAFARATADTATVQTTTSLLATVGSANASIGQEQAVRISAQSALASQLTTLGSSMGASIAALKEETDARTTQDTATTSQITTLQASVGTNTAAIQTEATVRASETGSLFAKYGVKVDLAGHVSGYGLMSTANNSVPESEFGVRADSFFVAPPSVSSSTAPSSNLYSGYAWIDTSVVPNVTKYWNGSAWVTTPPRLPFIVQTTATTINGVSVPAGVYIDTAFIRDGTITNAKIGNATIDKAKIASVDAATITAGFLSANRIDAESITADKIDTRGLTIKDAVGNVIFGSGTLLAASYITPSAGWLNSNVSLGGLGQNTFRVYSAGNSASAYHAAVGLYKNGTLVYGKSRSYMMARIRRSDGVVTFNQTYDVFGSTTNADTLAADLNATGSDSVVVVYTFDEPQVNRTSALYTAMYRCGASKGVFGKSTFRYRSAYILIGVAGCGEGNGFEAYKGDTDNDTEAWCDVGFVLVNGVPVISGVASKTVIDAANVSTYIAGAAIGNAQIGNRIQSTNFNGAIDEFGAVTNVGSAGWAIDKTGVAVFNNVRVRGDVEATSLNAATGTFSGTLNSVNGVFTGTLQGATGTFTGELLAGTLDLSKLVGTTLTYTSPGTYYATVPAGSTKMRVQVIGAGGGGASSGQSYDEGSAHGPGGGGGGVSIATYDVVAGNTYSVAVGAGGAGGAGRSANGNGTSGSPGGNSQIVGPGVNLVAYGGGGATAPNYRGIGAAVGAGGSGVTANGYAGQLYTTEARNVVDPKTGQLLGTENYPVGGGKGGNTGLNIAIGGAGGPGYYYVSPPGNGGVPGAGGGGSGIGFNNGGAYAGGSGANGRVVVEFYNPNGVVVRSEWVTLIAALQRQNIQTV